MHIFLTQISQCVFNKCFVSQMGSLVKCNLDFAIIILNYIYIYIFYILYHMLIDITKLCPTFVIPWTVTCHLPLSMGFSRQEDWSGLPFPSPGELSQHRNWTQVSCIEGRCFTDWAMQEAHIVCWERAKKLTC